MLSFLLSAVQSATTRRLLTGGIIVGSIGAETGLLVLNRFILSAGVYKFPYPIAATLIQCFVTFCLLRVFEQLSHVALPYIRPRHAIVVFDPDEEALLPNIDDAKPDSTEVSRESSPQRIPPRTDFRKQNGNKRFWDLIRLSFVYLSRAGLSNANIIHLPLPTYIIFRLGAVPLAFVFNSILNGDSHSALTLASSLLGMFSLALTVVVSASNNTAGDVLLAVSLPTLDALLPILLLDACSDRSPCFPPQESITDAHAKVTACSRQNSRLQEASRGFWSTLRQVSLLSTLTLLPIFLLSGEPQDIRRNSYILDVNLIWVLLISSGVVNALSLGLFSIVAKMSTPVTTTYLTVPTSSIIVVIFGSSLTAYGWTSIGLSWALSISFLVLQIRDTSITGATVTRSTYSLLRSMFIYLVLFGCVYSLVEFYHGEFTVPHTKSRTCEPYNGSPANITPPGASKLAVDPKDGYLGPRPDVNAIADIPLLVQSCAEVVNATGVDDVVNCLAYLAEKESEYMTVPQINSTQFATDVNLHKEETATATSIGSCPGEIIPFHVYWTGPATWRFELFVKAYLYTQNLPCSRLWIWVDEDLHPGAVDTMLCSDPIFARFLPLVHRGDITIKPWTFPTRIPVPKHTIANNATGLYITPHSSTTSNETFISPELLLDPNNNTYLAIPPTLGSLTPVQISDAVRFIVLHLHGGIYLDMDVLLLRDMRPLLLPGRAFAEQWVERCPPSAYNTAIISLPANSSLSTYLLRGGVRMGMNFHPLVIGRMMWWEGRNEELAMLQNAVFDPLVTNLRRKGSDVCTVPCHKNFKSAFMRVVEEPEFEWSNYHGPRIDDTLGTWPPTNRTLSNFFRGAWAYHIHNQWHTSPEPTSWMDVITLAQDGFFKGSRTNAYGEMWEGPFVRGYERGGWH